MDGGVERPNKYASNHRPAKLYEFRGQLMTTAEIAKLRGVCFSCISRRLRAGTPLDRPPHKGRWGTRDDFDER